MSIGPGSRAFAAQPVYYTHLDVYKRQPYTCAHHRLGRILYGALVGAASMGFRYFGVYETGVCFALLAVNSVSALIDRTEERLYRLLHRLPSERNEAAE